MCDVLTLTIYIHTPLTVPERRGQARMLFAPVRGRSQLAAVTGTNTGLGDRNSIYAFGFSGMLLQNMIICDHMSHSGASRCSVEGPDPHLYQKMEKKRNV